MNYYRYALCVVLLISYAYDDLAVVAQVMTSISTDASTAGGGVTTATTTTATTTTTISTTTTTSTTTPSPTTTLCPDGQKQGLAADGNANCLGPHPCSPGYSCLYSTTGNNYYCCSNTEVIPNATPSTTFTNCPNNYVEQHQV